MIQNDQNLTDPDSTDGTELGSVRVRTSWSTLVSAFIIEILRKI